MTGDAITARCLCGQLSATCRGDPVRVSVCHCHNCQRRSGSAFAAQIRFPSDRVVIAGETRNWSLIGESGNRMTLHFCPTCGGSVFYELETMPDIYAIPMGCFAGTDLPAPWVSVFENRKLPWVDITGDGIEHD